jgi:hypothetical protein
MMNTTSIYSNIDCDMHPITVIYYMFSTGISIYIAHKIYYIYNKIDKTVNENNIYQIKKDIYKMKSRSFDTINDNIVLNSTCQKIQEDINILKHKQFCYTQDLNFYKDKIKILYSLFPKQSNLHI